MAGEAVAAQGEEARKDPVASIAGQVANLSMGDRTSLRRLYLTQASGSRSRAADGVVIGLLHRAGVTVPGYSEAYEAWKLLAHVAAVLSGTGGKHPHAPGKRFGAALQAAGCSENRFMRLTAARGAPLRHQIRLAARMLAQSGETPVDLWSVLLLAGRDADEARIRIAQDYYAAQARSEGTIK
ncbi:type I-E CRISPR-associated protein Cse2/CasB [uncultured Sphingomonas sp.]|uniref:type I-E CRISPR-associated protein Cse2/CasB n=1 Tax=uncultured Sphingomonas sp. TaxID=158754 RepID=UPI0035CBA799